MKSFVLSARIARLVGLARRSAACAVLLALATSAAAADVVVGQVAPIDSPTSIGPQLRRGIQAYFNQLNRRGGVHGAQLKLVSKHRDVRATGEVISKTRELLAESAPVALIGYMGTGPMEALAKARVLDEAGIPLVGIRTGAMSLHDPQRSAWLFHTRANYAAEVNKILQHAATIGASKLAVYYEDSAFGSEALGLVEKAAVAHKVNLVARIAHKPAGTTAEDDARRAVESNANSILVAGASEAAAYFYRAYRAKGGSALVVTLSTADGALMVKHIGSEAARGLGIAHVVPDPASRSLPLSRELLELERAGQVDGMPLNQGFVEGYVAAKVLVEALRRAGPQPTRAKVRQALESMTAFDVGGFAIGYSRTRRSGSDYVDIAILSRDGKMLR